MKLFLTLAATFIGASFAHAEAKVPGTVLPYACAQSIRALGIVSMSEKLPSTVCYSSVVGSNQNVLLIDTKVYSFLKPDLVEEIGRLGQNGVLQLNLNTGFVTLPVQKTSKKLIIHGRLQVVEASNFEPIYHTQSAL